MVAWPRFRYDWSTFVHVVLFAARMVDGDVNWELRSNACGCLGMVDSSSSGFQGCLLFTLTHSNHAYIPCLYFLAYIDKCSLVPIATAGICAITRELVCAFAVVVCCVAVRVGSADKVLIIMGVLVCTLCYIHLYCLGCGCECVLGGHACAFVWVA